MSDIVRFDEHLVHGGFSYAYAVSAADITGDGSLDLVAVDTNVGLYWFENDGRGNFTRHTIRRRVGEWLERHAVADIDGDGRLEIVSVDNINGCLLYFEYDGDPRDDRSWRHRYVTEGGLPGAYDVAVADLDGDGDLDIAASGWNLGNQFCWFENRDGEWMKHMIEEDLPETRTICAADFDGDGRPDLLGTARLSGVVLWYRNPGDPTVHDWERCVIDVTPGPFLGNPADIDGDGHVDVVMAVNGTKQKPTGRIVWYENNGSPEFGPWNKHVIADEFPSPFEAVAGDVDGDGQVEVVATGRGEQGEIALFKHSGDPRGPWTKQTLRGDWNPTQVILADLDLDGDGRLDVVASSERGSNEIRWWRNEGPANA